MRTISAPLAETGDIFEGIHPEFSTSLPWAGDSIVIYCRKTRQYYDGEVMGAGRYAYSVLVGEKRSGRFRREARERRKMPPLGSLKNNSNVARGEQTRQRIVELLERHGGAMSQPEMEKALGITRDAIRYHMLRKLRGRVRRSEGPGRCTAWELVV